MIRDLHERVQRTAEQAPGRRVAVSVRDLDTGEHHAAGDAGEFGAASVVKVLLAARLLVEAGGEGLDASTGHLAHAMVTASDDDAANVLWARVGGRGLVPWVEKHFGVAGLGSPHGIPGRWGNTHVTAAGITALYGALRADGPVWAWLGPALHAITPVAADGTDQVFGLLAVDPAAAVKQGWADGSADDLRNAVVHSTGLVDGDRYAVAILTEGHGNVDGCDARGFHPAQAADVTRLARSLLA